MLDALKSDVDSPTDGGIDKSPHDKEALWLQSIGRNFILPILSAIMLSMGTADSALAQPRTSPVIDTATNTTAGTYSTYPTHPTDKGSADESKILFNLKMLPGNELITLTDLTDLARRSIERWRSELSAIVAESGENLDQDMDKFIDIFARLYGFLLSGFPEVCREIAPINTLLESNPEFFKALYLYLLEHPEINIRLHNVTAGFYDPIVEVTKTVELAQKVEKAKKGSGTEVKPDDFTQRLDKYVVDCLANFADDPDKFYEEYMKLVDGDQMKGQFLKVNNNIRSYYGLALNYPLRAIEELLEGKGVWEHDTAHFPGSVGKEKLGAVYRKLEEEQKKYLPS